MTTSIEERVLVQRRKRIKFCGEFADAFDEHIRASAVIISLVPPAQFAFEKILDIKIGDRILFSEGVFNVIHVATSDHLHRFKMIVDASKNDFESSMKQLKDLGCDVQFGRIESTRKDEEAERFFDSWVGTYAKNIIAHHDEIAGGRHIGELFAMFTHDVPVACVGAGPSLDKNIDLLKAFPGLIICADRAYRMLRARKIEPDFVISTDCHYDLIANMLSAPGNERHRLILNTCSDPAICKAWKGQIFWFNMKHPGVQFTDKILPALFPAFHTLENAGCVGNSSVVMADQMGLSPIILVGQDFAYTNGRMHAQEFEILPDESARPLEANHAESFEKRTGKVTVDGETTYVPFLNFRDTINALRNKRGLNIVNCTEGGILNDLPALPLSQMVGQLRVKCGDAYLAARKKLQSL